MAPIDEEYDIILDYVETNHPESLQIIQSSQYAEVFTHLKLAEKALIYLYTFDQSDDLNEGLYNHRTRRRIANSPFAKGLIRALTQLDSLESTVYKGGYLSDSQFANYGRSLARREPVIWHSFLSSSLSIKVAERFLTDYGFHETRGKNCLFIIESLTGKPIGQLSYYDINGDGFNSDEQEVLFLPGTKFMVLSIKAKEWYNEIHIREILLPATPANASVDSSSRTQ